MRHPWHYWLMYAAGLAAGTAAMGWLSWEAVSLDRAEARARQQAEQEDNIGRVLWRMDVRMMPLIAKEAARPYFLYQPFYRAPEADRANLNSAEIPSPLLTQRSEFVLLNFQLGDDNRITSAQLPPREDWPRAIACGARPEDFLRCEAQLAQLQSEVSYGALEARLPRESFEDVLAAPVPTSDWSNYGSRQFVANELRPSETSRAASATQSGVSQERLPAYVDYDEQVRLQRSQMRNSADLVNRNVKFQTLAEQQYLQQREELAKESLPDVSEGISRPVWVGERLLLARRVVVGGETLIQGCWLDWPQIRQVLLSESEGLLPGADLVAVTDSAEANIHRLLTTLPVQLVVAASAPPPVGWSPIRTSLLFAWTCLVLAGVAAALLLHGLLGLSERRAAFVSAVTHELRTPLTTFRLYSEMLAGDMLPDAGKRRQYLDTLRVEADRLGHLVENVLAYARLERGRRGRHCERLAVSQLVNRFTRRFVERAAQADMRFVAELEAPVAEEICDTDPGAVEQILFNLVDNSCKYAARAVDRRIHLRVIRDGGYLRFVVADHGPGVAADVAGRLFRPFCKSAEQSANSAPGVGLGLALSLRLARELGGNLELAPPTDEGAAFVLSLHASPGRRAAGGQPGLDSAGAIP
jgi:signal transduction histidine kinase